MRRIGGIYKFSEGDDAEIQEILRMKLENLQKNFVLFDPTKLPITQSKIPTEHRLEIYQNNIFWGLADVLQMTYPLTMKIVGENCFMAIVRDYIKLHPSKSGNLEDYGEYFAKFLHEFAMQKFTTKNDIWYLPDFADLEWKIHISTLNSFNNSADISKFQSLTEDKIYEIAFSINPSVILVKLNFTLRELYDFTKQPNSEDNFEITNSAEFILIKNGEISEISENEFLFFDMALNGKKFYNIYEKLCETDSEIDIGSIMSKFVINGVIVDFI